MELIKAISLVKQYGQGDVAVTALDNVSLSVEKGTFVAITGESGSGKSTLLNILGGMDRPTSGEVCLDGKQLPESDRELAALRGKDIGMVFQNYHLLPMLTAEENIEVPVRFAGKTVKAEEVKVLFEQLGLVGREHHLPSELSGGQQQRVAIGRALINHPKVLLADEPTGNLDKKTGEEIVTLLLRLKESYGMTLVMVTHNEKIAALADRIIHMEDGKIVSDEVRV